METKRLEATHITRSGLKAGIYSTDNRGEYPVHGWYEDEKGDRIIITLTKNLKYRKEVKLGGLDLFPLPKKIKVKGFVNFYECAKPEFSKTPEEGEYVGIKRIACVPIELEVEEGQGLENYQFNK
jgi:hypothetical protein